MKISFWDVLTGILLFAGFGVVLVFANIFIDPYTILNPFPPPTIPPTLKVPTLTPTLRSLPDIWTVTPTGNAQTVTLLPSLTPVASATGFVLPTSTSTRTSTPIPSLTPNRTNTPSGSRTNTPTNTPSAGAFAVTSVRNVHADPSSWNKACPFTILLQADIVANRSGQVTYYWIRKSSTTGSTTYSPTYSIDFNTAGTISTSTAYTGGYLGFSDTSTYTLYIDKPNHQKFTGFDVSITCTGFGITSNGGGATAAVSVAENTTAVTTVSSSLGGTTYSITGGSDAALFSINATTGVLAFKSAPNYEAAADSDHNNTYLVNVHAVNGSYTDDQLITVYVTDVNEAAPVISGGATASATVAENTPISTTIIDVNATDADTANTITYSISGGTDAADFVINASTGVLTFAAIPNYESPADSDLNNIYEVIVRASDGLPAHNVTQTITVTVTNVDEAPVITSNGGGASATISVPENSTAVTVVAATDGDAGATLTYSKAGGADEGSFSINATTGVLTFSSAPNYESPTDTGGDNSYNVIVQVSDGTNTDTQDITVDVTDVDETPEITSNGGGATADINVDENTTAVTDVNAKVEGGAAITYSISGTDAGAFDIDSSTGVLTFKSAPDYESPGDVGGDNIYNVTVEAAGGTGTDTQDLTITIIDLNDNSPVITSANTASIQENTTAVMTVTATDADAGTTFSYSLVGGADMSFFDINSGTGDLTFKLAPDFETPAGSGGNVYVVDVEVSDGANTDTMTITVTVTDDPAG